MTKWLAWLGRVFAHAVVRKVAALLVVGFLAWAGIGRAEAACTQTSPGYYSCSDPGQAYAQASSTSAALARCPTNYTAKVDLIGVTGPTSPGSTGQFNGTFKCWHSGMVYSSNVGIVASWTAGCPAGTTWNSVTHQCDKPCDQQPTKYHSAMKVATAMQCDSGCVYIYTIDPANPAGRIGTPQSGSCDAGDFGCPSGWVEGSGVHTSTQSQICTLDPNNDPGPDEKPDECPAGSSVDSSGACKPDSNTCPAGKTKGPDGSCIDSTCPAGQVKGPDGSCKKDGNGDGQPDADDGTFSGGDDCNTPPQCSGDAIACGQARIQWRIECNTRKNRNVSGGACSAMPICSGEKCDALEYSSLLMQWRSACALEALANGSVAGPGAGPGGGVFVGGGGGSGDGDTLGGIKDFLDGKGQGLGDAPAMPFVDGTADGESWSSGLGSGTCPAPVVTSVAFMGATFPIEFGFDFMCQFAAYIYWLVMGAAGVSSAFIIAGVRR